MEWISVIAIIVLIGMVILSNLDKIINMIGKVKEAKEQHTTKEPTILNKKEVAMAKESRVKELMEKKQRLEEQKEKDTYEINQDIKNIDIELAILLGEGLQ